MKDVMQLYHVAIYLRLSKDDGDISFSDSKKLESNSIHNQRELLISYLKKHPEMELYDEYKDCLLYTSPSPRDRQKSRMPSSA